MGVIPISYDLDHFPPTYLSILSLFVGLAFVLVSALICGCCRKKKTIANTQEPLKSRNDKDRRPTPRFKIEEGKEGSGDSTRSSLTPKDAKSNYKDQKTSPVGQCSKKGVSNKLAVDAASMKLKSPPTQVKSMEKTEPGKKSQSKPNAFFSLFRKSKESPKANLKAGKRDSPSASMKRETSKNTISLATPPTLELDSAKRGDQLFTASVRLPKSAAKDADGRDGSYLRLPDEGSRVDAPTPGVIPPILQQRSPTNAVHPQAVVDSGEYVLIDPDPTPDDKSESVRLGAAAKGGSLRLQSKYDNEMGVSFRDVKQKTVRSRTMDSQMTTATTTRISREIGNSGNKKQKKIRKKTRPDAAQSLMLQSLDVEPQPMSQKSPASQKVPTPQKSPTSQLSQK